MSLQFSSKSVVDSLDSVSKYLYQYGGVIAVVFGNLGCLLNVLVFTNKNLRKNPCSIYFIATNIYSFLFINSLLLAITLESGFNISYTTMNIALCRLRNYISLVSNVSSTYCLILASIDRVLVTSRNASIRQRSTLRTSYISVICGTIFWMLFHIPALIFSSITQNSGNIYVCFYQTGFYLTFIGYYSPIKEGLSILLLIIFGLRTAKNIRRVRRIKPPTIPIQAGIVAQNNPHIIQSKDRQFISMVLIDIIIFAIFCTPITVFFTQQQITQYQIKSVDQVKLGIFFRYMAIFCLYIPFGISCYTNLLISSAYRQAVKNVFLRRN